MERQSTAVVQERNPLHGVVDVATAALCGGLSTIEDMHAAIARKPFALLRLAPAVNEVSQVVRLVHDGVSSFVYASLRAAVTAGGSAARAAATLAADTEPEITPGAAAGMAVAALNGFAGDRLVRDGNPLATTMGLRYRGRHVTPQRAALADAYRKASPRLAVFVHGLALDESCWRLYSEPHYRKRHVTYGSRLQADFSYTPLYVRYNSGLHISENGRQLARLLEQVVSQWPVPVEELLVIGHSMGGLVSRSAGHYGRQSGHAWARSVRHMVFLGSPHRGAPLEKVANVAGWALGLVDITRPFAAVLNGRSAGVKDLRFGSLCDEDWEGVDLDALLVNCTGDIPLLDGANHYFVAATLTRDPRHPLGRVVGDLLVREPSASGRDLLHRIQFPLAADRHFGPMTHFGLLNHPDVYEQMRAWLEKR